jgi:hypothetical protein
VSACLSSSRWVNVRCRGRGRPPTIGGSGREGPDQWSQSAAIGCHCLGCQWLGPETQSLLGLCHHRTCSGVRKRHTVVGQGQTKWVGPTRCKAPRLPAQPHTGTRACAQTFIHSVMHTLTHSNTLTHLRTHTLAHTVYSLHEESRQQHCIANTATLQPIPQTPAHTQVHTHTQPQQQQQPQQPCAQPHTIWLTGPPFTHSVKGSG